jgi:hypothetical protein
MNFLVSLFAFASAIFAIGARAIKERLGLAVSIFRARIVFQDAR